MAGKSKIAGSGLNIGDFSKALMWEICSERIAPLLNDNYYYKSKDNVVAILSALKKYPTDKAVVFKDLSITEEAELNKLHSQLTWLTDRKNLWSYYKGVLVLTDYYNVYETKDGESKKTEEPVKTIHLKHIPMNLTAENAGGFAYLAYITVHYPKIQTYLKEYDKKTAMEPESVFALFETYNSAFMSIVYLGSSANTMNELCEDSIKAAFKEKLYYQSPNFDKWGFHQLIARKCINSIKRYNKREPSRVKFIKSYQNLMYQMIRYTGIINAMTGNVAVNYNSEDEQKKYAVLKKLYDDHKDEITALTESYSSKATKLRSKMKNSEKRFTSPETTESD